MQLWKKDEVKTTKKPPKPNKIKPTPHTLAPPKIEKAVSNEGVDGIKENFQMLHSRKRKVSGGPRLFILI